MDLTISRTTPVSREPAKKRGTIMPVRKSGSRQERRHKKRDQRNNAGDAVVVRLSMKGERNDPAPKDGAGS